MASRGTSEACVLCASVGYCRGLSSLPALGLVMCAVYTGDTDCFERLCYLKKQKELYDKYH